MFALRVALFLLSSILLLAQDPRGSISGRVVDTSDAVLVGAKVQATNVQTGVTAAASSNESGIFRIPFLMPGTYRLTVEAHGFKTYSQPALELRTGDALDLPIRLDIGDTSERVDVTAAAPILETGSSTLGQVIDERRLLELPQKGGDPFELMRLVPGVVNLTTLRTMKSSSPEGTSQISVNGSGVDQTQFQIDGINDTTNDTGKNYARVAFIPPSDAIVEFKMQANPYDASSGHVMGPVVSVTTKGGSNEIHGNLYYWFKNSVFDATDFFVNKAGQTKPVSQDNRYGLAVGGPVWIPRVYNGRNKTFFFYAWEENRFASPSTTAGQTSSIPTPAEKVGDFSALLALGSRYQIYNPFTTTPAPGGRFQRQPISGNIIPKSLLSPVGLNLAAYYPAPNQPPTADGLNNFFYPDVRHQRYDSHMARMDHAFSEKTRLFGRVNHYAYEIPKNALGIPASTFIQHQINEGAALDDVIVLSASLILNLRYGFTTAQFPEVRATQGTDLAKLGFSPALTSLLDPKLSTVPRVAISPFTTLSNWSSGDGTNTSAYHDWVADVTKLRGRHSFRFGADFRVMRTFGNRYQAAISPDFSFSTTYTQGPLDNSPAAPVGQQMAALLMGIPGGSMTVPANQSYAIQDKYMGLYIQDDFKLSPRLTLNLGVRYEMEWPVTERYNRLVAGFAYDASNPIEAAAKANYTKNPIAELPASQFSAKGGLLWVNQNGSGRGPYKTNAGQWLPRIGLAWQVTPKTVLRTGYGIYFGSLGVDTFVPTQTGFSQTTPIQASLDNGQTYVATLANPFPNGLIAPSGAAGGLTTSLGQAISFFNPNLNPPYSQRWSFGIQRQLPGAFLVDVSYVGNRTTHIAVTQQLNNTPAKYLSTSPVRDNTTINFLTQQVPNPFFGLNPIYGTNISRASLLQPYPEFGNVSVLQPSGYSWYHALQIKVERRLIKGFTLQMGYTHSKFMQATEFLNATDPTPYRVVSDMDRPNLFTMSGLWEIPVGRGRRFGSNMPRVLNFVIGNWQLDGSEVHQSGAPLSWGNIIFNGNLHDIPLSGNQTAVDRWFNVDAGFNRNSAQQLANNIRTFPLRLSGVRGDGQTIFNFSLLRNYTLKERFKTQFRAEAYNAFNHPVFDLPNTTPTSSTFGTVTQSISEARGIQLALKIVF